MVHLAGLTRLRHLDLDRTTVGNRGLASLSTLTSLRSLRLYDTRITDEGLARLLEGQPELDSLRISRTATCGRSLAALARPDRLRRLDVSLCPIELRHLRPFTELRHLSLATTAATDAELAHLSDLTELRILDSRTEVTDAGLTHLAKLHHLERLEVMDSKITEDGLQRFRALLGRPDLQAPLRSYGCNWWDQGAR